MRINGIEVIDYKHSGLNYESYKILEKSEHGEVVILQKSLTDNSTLLDVQIFDEYQSDDEPADFVIVPAKNLWHARRIMKSICE